MGKDDTLPNDGETVSVFTIRTSNLIFFFIDTPETEMETEVTPYELGYSYPKSLGPGYRAYIGFRTIIVLALKFLSYNI